jgi:antitoxin HicB
MKTMHEYRGFVFSVQYYPQDPAYLVDFPDIPEIITSGQTLADAFASACEALDLHLESLQKLGAPLPVIKHQLEIKELLAT